MAEEDDVRRHALSLPQTTEKPSYGTPGFRVKDRLFARIHDLPDTIVVWVADMAEKEALLAAAPEIYFETPHYDGYPMVLVRLTQIEPEELHDRTGYSRPHTVHCGPEGLYVSTLGSPDGEGPGGVFVMDHESFDPLEPWEVDRGSQASGT